MREQKDEDNAVFPDNFKLEPVYIHFSFIRNHKEALEMSTWFFSVRVIFGDD